MTEEPKFTLEDALIYEIYSSAFWVRVLNTRKLQGLAAAYFVRKVTKKI